MNFIISWTSCLHGCGSFQEALVEFSDLASADVAHLHRVNAATGAQRTIASIDRRASRMVRPLTRAHGMALVGPTLSRAKPGTLWSMQELDPDAATRLESRVLDWMEARSLGEAMLIPLSSAGDQMDVLEFYLSAPLDRSRRLGMELLAAAAAEAWGRRTRGRIAEILRAAPAMARPASSAPPVAHPLSESNPLGLTAAEFRICVMIQQGTSLTEAGRELGIAESTLRSHLRSIFAKAGVPGQVGLVRLLLDRQETTHPAIFG